MKPNLTRWMSDIRPFRRDPLNFLLGIDVDTAAPLERLHLGPQPVYLVTDPDLVKPILRSPEGEIDKGRLIRKLRSVIGDSIVILSGGEHKRRRAVLHDMLARKNLEQLAPAMSGEVRRGLSQALRAGSFDAHLFGSTLALRMICTAAFGSNVLTDGDEQALVNAVRLIEDDVADEIFRIWPLMPWAAYQRAKRRKIAHGIMKQVVAKVRAKVGGSGGLAKYDALGLSDDDLANEILTLLLAGHHTTGAAVAWLFHALASEPQLAERIAGEAASLMGDDGEIDPSRMAGARVTLTTIREVMRLFPSSWWFSREVLTPTEIGGRTLKAGTSLLISPWLFHRSPRFWDEPDTFRLDRTYSTTAYLPFGAGPRACIGMTLAMFELQLIALECSAALHLSYDGASRPEPEAQVMLMPPSMTIRATLRSDALAEVA